MEIFEERSVLESFSIIVDTREHKTDQAMRRYKSFGVPWCRGHLDYGDYTYNAILPDGRPLFDTSETIKPLSVIERKQSIDELCMCFGSDRDRFRREFERGRDAGAKMYLLIENASWENLYSGKYRSKFNPDALSASMVAWSNRYGFCIYMCKAETSGRLIKDLLYRDFKERLERGEFE